MLATPLATLLARRNGGRSSGKVNAVERCGKGHISHGHDGHDGHDGHNGFKSRCTYFITFTFTFMLMLTCFYFSILYTH